jgi:hypoxanthine phosphoribosyltransferase
MIQLHDKQFVPFLLPKKSLHAIAKNLLQVEADFKDEVPVFIGF